MRFHPSTLSDALIVHDGDVTDLLLAVSKLHLLSRFDNRRWWFAVEVARTTIGSCPRATRRLPGGCGRGLGPYARAPDVGKKCLEGGKTHSGNLSLGQGQSPSAKDTDVYSLVA